MSLKKNFYKATSNPLAGNFGKGKAENQIHVTFSPGVLLFTFLCSNGFHLSEVNKIKVNKKIDIRTYFQHLWTYFTPCSSVSMVNFEHAIAGWVEGIFPWLINFWENCHAVSSNISEMIPKNSV